MASKYSIKRKIRNYWCVSLDDIKSIIDIFSQKFTNPTTKAFEADYESGNNIKLIDGTEFVQKLYTRHEEKDTLNELRVTFSELGEGKDEKSLSLNLNFKSSGNSSFSVFICNGNKSYKEWLRTTYTELNAKVKTFLLKSKYRSSFEKYSKSEIVFDQDGEIKKAVIKDNLIKSNITKARYKKIIVTVGIIILAGIIVGGVVYALR